MTNEEFEILVGQGIDAIDEKFLGKLKNVEIVIEDDPTPEQAQKLNLRGLLLFGLYEGIPQTKRQQYGQVLPDKITIYKGTIEKFAGNPARIPSLVRRVVWHEIGHHFGFDEEGIQKLEKKWQQEGKL